MFGKDDLVDNLSRDLDRARGRRDALASEVTTLTAQIAEMEARLSEENTRRERDRALGEIEAAKKQIKHAARAFAPVIGKLCEAVEMAAAIVPEAHELNSFLLSVAGEVDSVVDPLLRELDQRADAVRGSEAALDLPCSANGAPIEPPSNSRDRLLRFPVWLSRIKGVEKKETTQDPRGNTVNYQRARPKKDPDVLQQHCPRYDAAFVANQILKKLEWGKKKNVLATPAGSPRNRLDDDIADTQNSLLDNGVTASAKRLDAREELKASI